MTILEAGKLVAAFLLNIKGRIVEDLILWQRNQDLLIECSTKTRDDLKKTLEKYRMRKKVDIVASDEPVCFSTENGDFQDPRLSSLGFRSFGKDGNENVGLYHQKRRELGIAEGSEEIAGLLPFQCNGDLLNMISLDKGCYIGQELTARTAHTGVIRKRILPFKYEGNGELEKIVTDENKKKAGEVGLFFISRHCFICYVEVPVSSSLCQGRRHPVIYSWQLSISGDLQKLRTHDWTLSDTEFYLPWSKMGNGRETHCVVIQFSMKKQSCSILVQFKT